ncbi:MAG: hypothetical protein EBV83_07465 [Verrucomicrobia bacterium]|nr:hypothetical protein [Verrucomicrobiota bacterium]
MRTDFPPQPWLSGVILAWITGALFLCPTAGQSQAPGEISSSTLVVVNTLPGPGNLFVKLGPEAIWPPGFTPGQSTGAVVFPSGKKVVEARCEGFVTSRMDGELAPKANCAMVFYPGAEVKEGPDKGKRKIGLFQPEPLRGPVKGKNWHIILVGTMASSSLEINGKTVTLQPGRAEKIELGGKNFVEVKQGGESILAQSPEEPGEYWVVVYEAQANKLAAALLNHLAYPVP